MSRPCAAPSPSSVSGERRQIRGAVEIARTNDFISQNLSVGGRAAVKYRGTYGSEIEETREKEAKRRRTRERRGERENEKREKEYSCVVPESQSRSCQVI